MIIILITACITISIFMYIFHDGIAEFIMDIVFGTILRFILGVAIYGCITPFVDSTPQYQKTIYLSPIIENTDNFIVIDDGYIKFIDKENPDKINRNAFNLSSITISKDIPHVDVYYDIPNNSILKFLLNITDVHYYYYIPEDSIV